MTPTLFTSYTADDGNNSECFDNFEKPVTRTQAVAIICKAFGEQQLPKHFKVCLYDTKGKEHKL
jgi:hypothetical protein